MGLNGSCITLLLIICTTSLILPITDALEIVGGIEILCGEKVIVACIIFARNFYTFTA